MLNHRIKLAIAACVICVFQACRAKERNWPAPTSIRTNVSTTQIYQGSDVIWAFQFIEANRILFTERAGPIRILDIKTKKTTSVQNAPETVQHGQGGRLDIELHPNFATNHLVYLSYTVEEKKGFETRIARAKLEDNKLQDLQVLFTSNSGSTKGEHFGSRIVFDHQGHIFFSIGERGNRHDAQKLTMANGKIHRLNEDGSIPQDNPFVKDKTAVQSIWSFGHRNPQGLFYDQATQTLWENEHGPQGGDEINVIEKGKNYGWPEITYGREYYGPPIGTFEKKGMEQPLYYYVPSIAPSGLVMYKGSLYTGALKLTHLNRVTFDQKKFKREERLLENIRERIRDIRVGPDDQLYISTDSGQILQVKI